MDGNPDESASASGAVYVFVQSGTDWTQQAYLKPAAVGTTQAGDVFGNSVAASDDTLVIGSPGEGSSTTGLNSTPDEDATYSGAVYVFMRGGTNWTQQAYLKPAAIGTTQASDNFGVSVAVSCATVVVGAPWEDSSTTGVNSTPDESATNSGAAYVFSPLPAPFISSITGVNPFQFQFDGNGISAFQVQASTNLTHWIFVGNATNIGGSLFQFGDPGTTNFPYRFYRLVWP